MVKRWPVFWAQNWLTPSLQVSGVCARYSPLYSTTRSLPFRNMARKSGKKLPPG